MWSAATSLTIHRTIRRADRWLPRRAPWIDLSDLRAKGALLVWNAGDLEHRRPSSPPLRLERSRNAFHAAGPTVCAGVEHIRLGDPSAEVNYCSHHGRITRPILSKISPICASVRSRRVTPRVAVMRTIRFSPWKHGPSLRGCPPKAPGWTPDQYGGQADGADIEQPGSFSAPSPRQRISPSARAR